MAAPARDQDSDDPDDGDGDDAREAPPVPTTLKVGAVFHLFYVVALIGRGGTSEVYKIRFKGEHWALKVPRHGFEVTPDQRQRFEREASLLMQIVNPNVIDVQDCGYNEGIFWIRMELLDGLDLREAITRLGAMSVGLVGAWLVQAAYGVHQCHEQGLVHRDLKPENVFITRDNVVKILDFGIVKHEHAAPTLQTGRGTAAPIGTAPYMSPEQARCSAVGAASDVYALGMMMWEMLVGEHPFLLGGAPYEFWGMLQKQVLEQVPPLTEWGFPPYLSRVAERALSKRPADRQPNGLSFADELLSECKGYLRAHPEEEPNPGEPTIAWLLDANIQVPSFGTGPQSGRPSVPPPRGSKPPAERLPVRQSAAPRPVIRFGTLPLGTLLEALPQPVERDTEPAPPPIHTHDAPAEGHERDTDPSGPPLEVRQFDTVSLPPELRDPSAIRALAAYRPPRPASPGGALTTGGVAAARPPSPQDTGPAATDRVAFLPGAAHPAAEPPPPKGGSSERNGAAGEGQARGGTPTGAVVSVTPRPASDAAPSPPSQPAAQRGRRWERAGPLRLFRRLPLAGVLVVVGFALALVMTLDARVGRSGPKAKPSPALQPPNVSATTTATASSEATSHVPPSPAASSSPATVAAPTAEPSASAPAPLAVRSSTGAAAPRERLPMAVVTQSTSVPAAPPPPRGQGMPAAGPRPTLLASAASSSGPPAPPPAAASSSTLPAPAPSVAPHRVFGSEN
jgi:serine/threonine-protein kinase